jgi:hypothetical protein
MEGAGLARRHSNSRHCLYRLITPPRISPLFPAPLPSAFPAASGPFSALPERPRRKAAQSERRSLLHSRAAVARRHACHNANPDLHEKWQAAGAISVVGKAVLTLRPPLGPLSHNANPRDGAQYTGIPWPNQHQPATCGTPRGQQGARTGSGDPAKYWPTLDFFFLSGFLAGKKIGRVQLRLPGANKKNR